LTGKPLIESDRVEGTTVDRDYDWTDRQREQELHDYYGAPYYWGLTGSRSF